MGAVTSACGGCFAGFKKAEPKPKVYEPFIPQDPPAGLGKLAVQVRIQARQSDEESLEISKTACNLDPALLDEQGRNALFYAVRGIRDDDGNWDRPGGTLSGVVNKTYSEGCTAHGAAQYLIQTAGIDVNFQTYDTGMTPLMEAARHGNMQTTIALLKYGADWKIMNSSGHTAFDIANSQLPDYYTFKESCFSSNRWQNLCTRVQQDRMYVARILEEVQIQGSAEPVLANMRAALQQFIDVVEQQQAAVAAQQAQAEAEGTQAGASAEAPTAEPTLTAEEMFAQREGMIKNPNGTYTLEGGWEAAAKIREAAARTRAETIRAEHAAAAGERHVAAKAAAKAEASGTMPAEPPAAVEKKIETQPVPQAPPDAAAVKASQEEMEVVD